MYRRAFDPHTIKFVIFDLDGTLIDSRLDLVHSVNAALRHIGRDELPEVTVASYVGDGAPILIQRALGGEQIDEALVCKGLEVYGEQVQRLIEKDDKPLPEKDANKEEEKLQKIIEKRKNESDEARRKREEKEEKDRKQAREFVREIADAYTFKLIGIEALDGREAWVIEGEPRPGFEPHMREAKFLAKFRGRVWIDKGDLQMAKMDVEAIDTVSLGWVLARIHKGTRVMFEQTRVNDEVWLPQHVTFRVDGRLALVKGFNVDGEQTFRDYKKFRSSAKIVAVGEVKEDK